MNKIKQFLAKPFPQEESIAQTIWIAAGISLFVVLFLYIFKPFGMHIVESGFFLLCMGFGVVSFVTSAIYEFMVVQIFNFKGQHANFTFARWILYFIGVMFFISLANFIFVRLVMFDDIQWSLYPYMLRGTFAIGLFPVVVVGALALLKQEQKYQAISNQFNHDQASSHQLNEQQIDATIFGIDSQQIRFIEAMQNYININYLDADGADKVKTKRATFKSVSDAAHGSSILQSHRSYFVNVDHITSSEGNAQGLLLTLQDCPQQIPVSRSYVAQFRDLSTRCA